MGKAISKNTRASRAPPAQEPCGGAGRNVRGMAIIRRRRRRSQSWSEGVCGWGLGRDWRDLGGGGGEVRLGRACGGGFWSLTPRVGRWSADVVGYAMAKARRVCAWSSRHRWTFSGPCSRRKPG